MADSLKPSMFQSKKGITTSYGQQDPSSPRCVAHVARAGPFGQAANRYRPVYADWEGLVVVGGQHLLCQVLAESIVGVIEVELAHHLRNLQPEGEKSI